MYSWTILSSICLTNRFQGWKPYHSSQTGLIYRIDRQSTSPYHLCVMFKSSTILTLISQIHAMFWTVQISSIQYHVLVLMWIIHNTSITGPQNVYILRFSLWMWIAHSTSQSRHRSLSPIASVLDSLEFSILFQPIITTIDRHEPFTWIAAKCAVIVMCMQCSLLRISLR